MYIGTDHGCSYDLMWTTSRSVDVPLCREGEPVALAQSQQSRRLLAVSQVGHPRPMLKEAASLVLKKSVPFL
jgi:DNA-binding IclR family transcriptional regulator